MGNKPVTDGSSDFIAIIGMACRFPGADDVRGYWRNLLAGFVADADLSDRDLDAAGVPEPVRNDPRYVRHGYFLDGATAFDAEYFGLTDAEAQATDPGHRLLLECVDTALADAGHQGRDRRPRVGLFAGMAPSGYSDLHVARNRRLVRQFGEFALRTMSESAFLATRASHRLGLDGPSVTLSTACSTGLVAVHLGSQALRDGDCDIAVAAAVDLSWPCPRGYLRSVDGLYSSDGRCRSFDASADGTVFSSGVGAVVLRPLSRALADQDHIYAVIRASAVNNDGAERLNFATPNWERQAEVIQRALADAGLRPSAIGYVECHAAGTLVGDITELQALTATFGQASATASDWCAIGSVKPNIGHPGVAAGMAGLIKTALAVRDGTVPPTANFTSPHPELELQESPFFVNRDPVGWPVVGGPRRAGVSSFGAGGTNAHVILEQPPSLELSGGIRGVAPPGQHSGGIRGVAPPGQHSGGTPSVLLLPFSAPTRDSLDRVADRVRSVVGNGDAQLADVAFTLQTGRAHLPYRGAMLVSCGAGSAPASMTALPVHASPAVRRPRVAFFFAGSGTEYVGMGRELHATWPAFREQFDGCCRALASPLGAAVRAATLDSRYPGDTDPDNWVRVGQPALFAVQYALARLLMSWGIRPDAVIGHSTGEYAAACVADALPPESAVRLVAARAELFTRAAPGQLLAVLADEDETRELLGEAIDIAAVNSPTLTVVAGTPEAIATAAERCGQAGVMCKPLRSERAYHSRHMEPIVPAYRLQAEGEPAGRPRRRMASTVTGDWLSGDAVLDADYWCRHMRQPVRFVSAASAVLDAVDVCIEIGPGSTLSGLLEEVAPDDRAPAIVSTMSREDELRSLLAALGVAWAKGVTPDWVGLWPDRPPRRTPLPPYPYQRRVHLAMPDPDLAAVSVWDVTT